MVLFSALSPATAFFDLGLGILHHFNRTGSPMTDRKRTWGCQAVAEGKDCMIFRTAVQGPGSLPVRLHKDASSEGALKATDMTPHPQFPQS